MSKKKIMRKPTPQPPKWYWWNSDGCWDCNRGHVGCHNCPRLKEIKSQELKKRKREDKIKMTKWTK